MIVNCHAKLVLARFGRFDPSAWVFVFFLTSFTAFEVLHLGRVGICWAGSEYRWNLSETPTNNFFGLRVLDLRTKAEARLVPIGLLGSALNQMALWAVLILILQSIYNLFVTRSLRVVLMLCVALSIVVLAGKITDSVGCVLLDQHLSIARTYLEVLGGKDIGITLRYFRDAPTKITLIKFSGIGIGGEENCAPYFILDPLGSLVVPQSALFPHWFSATDFSKFPVFRDKDEHRDIYPLFGQKDALSFQGNNIRKFEDKGYSLISCFPRD